MESTSAAVTALPTLRLGARRAVAPAATLSAAQVEVPRRPRRVQPTFVTLATVIVLTTSTEEEEIVKMYKLRCSSYIAKPVDFEQFCA